MSQPNFPLSQPNARSYRPMTEIERQQAFVDRIESSPMPCPVCTTLHSAKEKGDTHTCSNCQTPLTKIVPFGPMTPPYLWSVTPAQS